MIALFAVGLALAQTDETLAPTDEGEAPPPRHHQLPQNPYGSTDFTAYTREFGELRVGLATVTYGVAPRVHLGTLPALDAAAMFNGHLKINFVREGPFDMAVVGQIVFVPVSTFVERFGLDDQGGPETVEQTEVHVDSARYVNGALVASLQIVGGWSIHGAVGYASLRARGAIDIQEPPEYFAPGVQATATATPIEPTPRAMAELVDVRFATDYRFNRRDSLIFQTAATVYASIRGAASAEDLGIDTEYEDMEVILQYSQNIPVTASYRMSIAWQFSWTHLDLRFGFGWAAAPLNPYGWLLQPFDIAYRFGGRTRREETDARKSYRNSLEPPEDDTEE